MVDEKVVTMKGNPLTLLGSEVKVGEKAVDFNVLDTSLKGASLDNFKGKIKLIASVPSLDTPVCDLEIKRFNEEAAKLSEDLAIIFISMDLPFAQKRFCQANSINKVETLSDYKDADFGLKYGVLIKELRLLARAIFIIDKENTIQYIELVKEISQHPNYDEAIKALKKII
ncbi:MAG: thiol peroxidase [Candidatus Omnitrophota bacterium]|jgi:thiol peroxidase|nr:thiol peroxidase [Candidatus Omnitrophota bacterium]